MILLVDDSHDLAKIMTALTWIDPGEIIIVEPEKKPEMSSTLCHIIDIGIALAACEMHDVTETEDNSFDEPMFRRYQARTESAKVRRRITTQTARGPPDLQAERVPH